MLIFVILLLILIAFFIIFYCFYRLSMIKKEPKRLLISGAKGKMGSYLALHLATDYQLILLDQEDDIEQLLNQKIDLIVDFSVAAHASYLIERALQCEIPVLSGTTGISSERIRELVEIALKHKTSLVIQNNFSSVLPFLLPVARSFQELYPSVDIALREKHHVSKKDMPSGTALQIAHKLGIDSQMIISERVSEYVPTQIITLTHQGERITLIHEALDRTCYLKNIKRYLKRLEQPLFIEVNGTRYKKSLFKFRQKP